MGSPTGFREHQKQDRTYLPVAERLQNFREFTIPLEDITVIGANEKYLDAEPRDQGIETIKLIMKDGKIYKNTLK